MIRYQRDKPGLWQTRDWDSFYMACDLEQEKMYRVILCNS